MPAPRYRQINTIFDVHAVVYKNQVLTDPVIGTVTQFVTIDYRKEGIAYGFSHPDINDQEGIRVVQTGPDAWGLDPNMVAEVSMLAASSGT
jgi:hypothetical protein